MVKDPKQPLKKELGLLSVFSIAAGSMISSGLFVLPGLAFEKAGPATILSYALASVLMIPVMFSQAELATAMPKSGGSYFYIERSMGPLAGTVAGFTNWFSIALKSAFALVGIGALCSVVFPGIGTQGIKVVAIVACLFFSLLNIVGTKKAGGLQTVLALALLIIIGLYSLGGIQSLNALNYTPFMSSGLQSVFAVAGMVFVSYGGLTKVASISEEVHNPSRNLPWGMFLAFGIVSMLYILVVFVTVGVVEEKLLSGSLVPLSLGAEIAIGRWGMILVDVGALFAFATTANAGILSASRSPMAMSRDGLLPELFSKTNSRFATPHFAIMVTTLFISAVIAFLSIEDLVKTASTMMILMFILVNLSVIIMRYSGLQNYRPSFKAPLFPWIQIIAIVTLGFLVFEMGKVPLLLTILFIFLALVWYLAYINRRIIRESAFVYMVKSIVAKDITRSGLEEELKQITLERDRIALDRFDHLVKQAAILDLQEQLSAKDMFHKVAAMLSERLNKEQDMLYELFLKREMESGTVIRPGLAIPHIIIEGNHIFDLLLVRCKKGIIFSELHPPVTIAFVLVGSMDERNYHLRALMNIAHIVQEKDFEKMWEKARNIEELRDIILLSKRQREHYKLPKD